MPGPAARMERTSAARHRPNATARLSAASERRLAVGGAQRVQLGQLGSQPGVPGRGGAGDERLGDRAERAERLLRGRLRPDRPPRRRPRAAVVVIEDRGLTRRDQDVLGGDLAGAGHDHQQPPVTGAHPHLGADQPDRHGVAGRPEPHAGQPVDLAGHQPPDAGPQRRQRREQLPLDHQPLGGHRADLAVDHAVDLGAPRRGRHVGGGQVTEGRLRHHQVALGIPDEIFDDSLALRVVRLAEIRPEPVVRREPQVLRRGHHDVGDHPALQAAHPVGQHLARHPAQHLEALRQHRQRRLRALISGEPHEPDPAPGQHRAEHVQAALGAPVDHQVLTRRPHRRTAAAVMIPPPGLLGRRDQAAEVPRRPRIPRGPRRRQQPLRRDPARGLPDPLRDQPGHGVVVPLPRRPRRRAAAGLVPGDHPPDGLRGRAADRGRPPESTCLTVGRNDVHPIPRRLQ